MAGAAITIDVDDAEVRRALGDLIRRLQHPAKAMGEIGEHMQRTTQARFGSQNAPDGTPWAANKPATKARKRNPNILTESGLLGDTIRWQLTDGGRGVAVGSNLVYAAIHQFGGEITIAERAATLYFRQNGRTGEVGQRFVKKGRSNFAQDVVIGAHAVSIPPRPFLGLSGADKIAVLAILRDYISA